MQIGVIGAGNIGLAIAGGLLDSGIASPNDVYLSRRNIQMLQDYKNKGCNITSNNLVVMNYAKIIIIGVKPYLVLDILREIKPHVTSEHLIISAAMGVSTQKMEENLPPMSRVIRCTPNTAALVRSGVVVFSCGRFVRNEDADLARKIFSCIGFTEQIEEKLMDAVTGLSGSGPAYIFMTIEALADGGVKMGIRRDLALKLAAHTVFGAAKMVIETERHPCLLKDEVTSPGGCTIRALHELEKNGYRSALISAVEAATLKSKEAGEEANKDS